MAHAPSDPMRPPTRTTKPRAWRPIPLPPRCRLRPAPSHPWRKWLLWAGAVVGLAVGGYLLTPAVETAMNTVSTDDAYVNGHVTLRGPPGARPGGPGPGQ